MGKPTHKNGSSPKPKGTLQAEGNSSLSSLPSTTKLDLDSAITDKVLAPGVFFANFNRWMVLFVAVIAALLYFLPSWTSAIIRSFGRKKCERTRLSSCFWRFSSSAVWPRWPRARSY